MAAISITAANVIPSSTASRSLGVAAATITAGQAVYITAAGTINLADANGTSPANTFAGIAENGATVGQKISYVTNDTAGFTIGATVLAGDTIWLSPTAGGLTKTFADFTTLDKIIVVGVMLTTTTMNLTPVTGGVLA